MDDSERVLSALELRKTYKTLSHSTLIYTPSDFNFFVLILFFYRCDRHDPIKLTSCHKYVRLIGKGF